MSSDPNKRKHFRYLAVFSVLSCFILKLGSNSETLKERVTIVVRDTQKYVKCDYGRNPSQTSFEMCMFCFCCDIMYSLS